MPADLRHPGDGGPARADAPPGGFPRARKGYEPAAVDRYVAELSAALRAAERREADLRERVADLERRAAVPELDEAAITAAIGSETARVLQAAHEAAREVVAGAERRAAELLDEVDASLAARREELERDVAARSAAAAAEAEERRAAAEREAAELLESTKAECRAMLEESRALRARVLADLAERRRQLHVQLEQLRAGRDRLAAVIDTVGAAVDELRAELHASERAAREAAEEAGRRAAGLSEDAMAGDGGSAGPATGRVPEGGAGGEAAASGDGGGAAAGALSGAGGTASFAAGEEAAPPWLGPVEEAGRGDAARDPASEGAEPAGGALETGSAGEAWEEGVSILGPAPRPSAAAASAVEEPEEPVPPTGAEEPAEESGGAAPQAPAVDELFARIRANRAADVARARATLEAARRGEEEAETPSSLEPGVPAEEEAGRGTEEEAEEPSFVQRDELLAPILPVVARALKRALQDDQNELLDALRHAPSHADLAAVLPAAVAEPRFVEAVRAGLEQAVAAGRRMAALFEPGLAARAPERRADARLAAAEAARVARSLVASLRLRLEHGLVGLSADEGGAADVVGAAYREWRGSRAERLAADGVHAAFNAALLASFRREGGGGARRLRWAVFDEDGGCAECDDNALAGPVPAGEPFPTGETSPPIHPGCRCLLVPVGD